MIELLKCEPISFRKKRMIIKHNSKNSLFIQLFAMYYDTLQKHRHTYYLCTLQLKLFSEILITQ